MIVVPVSSDFQTDNLFHFVVDQCLNYNTIYRHLHLNYSPSKFRRLNILPIARPFGPGITQWRVNRFAPICRRRPPPYSIPCLSSVIPPSSGVFAFFQRAYILQYPEIKKEEKHRRSQTFIV